MYKRRLLKLADVLERDAKNKKGVRFNMTSWGLVSNRDEPVSCGTSACAMGLAALSGAFSDACLKASINFGGRVNFKWKRRVVSDGFLVAQKLFGITEFQAGRLFEPRVAGENHGAKAERAKAREIRKFVATGEL